MNNSAAREKFIAMEDKLKNSPSGSRISKIHGFYMSVLEHEWVIILEADAAHDIETFCIEVGISSTSTVKIVPLNNFADVVKRVKSAGISP